MAERKQRRARQRRGFVDLINALLTLIVIAILVVGGLLFYGVHNFYAPGPIMADTNFTVEKGNNLATVGQRLEDQGLIDNRYIFQIGAWATKKQGALKAGEFKLSADSSMDDVLKELTEGKPVQHGITIPEGFTIAQVVDRLTKDDRLTGDLTSIPPEGGVLPQTYNFEPGVSRQSVLDQMVEAQQAAVADVWASHDPGLPITTPDQLVILASIVEKETGVASERGHVAAVFVNRLEKHMRLQSDPTIIYGITKGEAPLGRPLKRSEVEAATPYNTYQVDGLPPTPIDNPGIDALKAVANPDKSDDIYFVAATTNPADGHLFASTYAAHRKNVAKLRVAERQQAAVDAEADADAAKDQLEEQQAAASGDSSATDADGDTDDATDQSAAAPSADQPPTAPAETGTTPSDAGASGNRLTLTPPSSEQPAPATTSGAPIPMPATSRPGGPEAATLTAPAATAPVAPATTTSPAATPAKPAPARPARPRPTPVPEDTFGG